MMNRSGAFESGSYGELREHVLQQLRTAKIHDHVFELIQAAFDSALVEEDLVLSAAEKRLLLRDVLKSILDDMNKRLGLV